MIDFALEKYPITLPLDAGLTPVFRPLECTDHTAFLVFLQAVPECERLFIKQRLEDPALLRSWCNAEDPEARLSLTAWQEDQIIGFASLEQRPGGWKRHIGTVRALTHPDFRGVGLAAALVGEIIHIARHCGLSHLQAEFNGERDVAIHAFASHGFVELTRLTDYLMDMEAHTHPYVLMGLDLTTAVELAGAGD